MKGLIGMDEIKEIAMRIKELREIERIIENDILTTKIEKDIENVKEAGLKELLIEAIEKHKSPYPQDNKDAVEKIWDAFERLKTYYTQNR